MKKKNLIRVALMAATTIVSANLSFAQSWNLTGNAGTDPATNFIGTTDNKALKIKTNNAVRLTVTNNGKVGIGTAAPNASLDVLSASNATAGNFSNSANSSSATYGLYASTNNNGTGGEYAGTFYALGTGGGNTAIYAYAQNGSQNVGIVSGALTTTGQTGYGIMAGSAGTGTNWAGYFSGQGYFSEKVGIGNSSPAHMLDVASPSTATSSAIYSHVNYTGTVDVKAIEGISTPANGYGIGLEGTGGYIGVNGKANAGNYAQTAYGVQGIATGTAGIRIGVFGEAIGGTYNWAGYFNGHTYVSGNMLVGTTTAASGYKLSVNGKIICEELKVELHANWPDYVFEKEHKLMPLDQLEEQIAKDKHLPGIPSACEIEDNGGLQVGEMQTKMMEKIEELTLYVIQLKKDNDALQLKVNAITQK
ncbi:MAG: hypothetical protein ABI723_09095 [Bacteroidia bacterium]